MTDRPKPLFPTLDPVRPAAEMGLTAEQMDWLLDIARPRCCHTTGEHDPTHFKYQVFVCREQLAEIAFRLRVALGKDDRHVSSTGWYDSRKVDPAEAISMAGCGHCFRPDGRRR